MRQAFSQFRSKLAKKTEDEIETLKRNPKVTYEFFTEWIVLEKNMQEK